MNPCPKCNTQNRDNAGFCAKCDSDLSSTVKRKQKTVKLSTMPVMPLFGGQDAKPSKEPEPEPEPEADETPCNECKELILAEQKLEKQLQRSSELSNNVGRLSIEIETMKKKMTRGLVAALAIIVVMLIFAIAGFLAKGKIEEELAGYRLYREMYDSVFVLSRNLTAERDSLRIEFAEHLTATEELRERYNELTSNQRTTGNTRNRSRINIPIEMVSVRGGRFVMGCTAEQGTGCDDNEKPARNMTVGNFSISKYPVTQDLWKQVMGFNPSHYKGDKRPVEQVSWRDAQEFINRLNTQTGRRYRLPTEVEWEYAARGGANSRGYRYAGSNSVEEVAWCARTGGTHVVGTKKPNELGIHDMSGNVREWVSDRYGKYGETTAASVTDRVLRGGSWTQGANASRVSARIGYGSGARGNYVGFRLAESR